MNALALVRVPEDPEALAEALKKSLDPRFELTLLNIIDPALLQPGEARDRSYLNKLEEATREELEDIAKIMRGMGFKCKVKVETGPLLEVL
ncbi:universal stress protein, partial [Candidatus Bathyarchaeota archaeon]